MSEMTPDTLIASASDESFEGHPERAWDALMVLRSAAVLHAVAWRDDRKRIEELESKLGSAIRALILAGVREQAAELDRKRIEALERAAEARRTDYDGRAHADTEGYNDYWRGCRDEAGFFRDRLAALREEKP